MSLAFACAMGHAPGITAWRERAPAGQRQRLDAAFAELQRRLAAAHLDGLVVLTAEHWTNFFLDHISPFCIGRASSYPGPVEPWVRIPHADVPGDPQLAAVLLEAFRDHDIDVGFAHEMAFDHGTMIPLHFLTPDMTLPVVPIVINTLAPPVPAPRRCLALGTVVGEVVRNSTKRLGIVATGGLSHDPGERRHGFIDQEFDRRFLGEMSRGEWQRLASYTTADLAAAGSGALEMLTWIALAGAVRSGGEVLAYEPVIEWATGIGAMAFNT